MDPSDKASPKYHMAQGKYANHFAIGYSQHEFIFDFGQSYSEIDPAELCSRIVTSPVYAKLFYELLMKTIAEYESQFDAIKDGLDGG